MSDRQIRLGTGDTLIVRRPDNLGVVSVLVDAAPVEVEIALLQGEARQLAGMLLMAVQDIEQEQEAQR